MKRFVIQHAGDYSEDFHFEFTMDTTGKAVKAFRTLYGQAEGYVLYEQVAVSDPAGSHTEPNNSSGETGVQQTERLLDNLSGK